MALPHSDILEAVHARLSSKQAAPVRYAGAGGPAPDEYVAIDMPTAPPRDTKTTRGHTVTLVCRCHTEHPLGRARPLDAYALADAVHDALSGWAPDIGPSHAALDLSSPDVSESTYSIDSDRQALDIILRYTLITQTL